MITSSEGRAIPPNLEPAVRKALSELKARNPQKKFDLFLLTGDDGLQKPEVEIVERQGLTEIVADVLREKLTGKSKPTVIKRVTL